MRLEDFGIILLMLAACAVALFGGMALVSLWPQIRQFVCALWRRYVTFSWDDLLWRVADAGVNDFEEPAPPPFVNRPVMSRSGASVPPVEPVRAGTKTTDTYQVRGGTPPPQETPEPSDRDIISRRMSSAELVTLLAVQQNKGGGYRYSKNQIAAFVGGTRAETLRLISEARGEAQPQYRPLDERSRPMLR